MSVNNKISVVILDWYRELLNEPLDALIDFRDGKKIIQIININKAHPFIFGNDVGINFEIIENYLNDEYELNTNTIVDFEQFLTFPDETQIIYLLLLIMGVLYKRNVKPKSMSCDEHAMYGVLIKPIIRHFENKSFLTEAGLQDSINRFSGQYDGAAIVNNHLPHLTEELNLNMKEVITTDMYFCDDKNFSESISDNITSNATQKDMNVLVNQMKVLKDECFECKHELMLQEEDNTKLCDNIKNLDKNMAILKAQNNDYHDEIVALMEKTLKLEGMLNKSETEKEKHIRTNNKLNVYIEELKYTIDDLENDCTELQIHLDDTKNQLLKKKEDCKLLQDTLTSERDNIETKNNELESEMIDLRKQLHRLEIEKITWDSKLNTDLETLSENIDSFELKTTNTSFAEEASQLREVDHYLSVKDSIPNSDTFHVSNIDDLYNSLKIIMKSQEWKEEDRLNMQTKFDEILECPRENKPNSLEIDIYKKNTKLLQAKYDNLVKGKALLMECIQPLLKQLLDCKKNLNELLEKNTLKLHSNIIPLVLTFIRQKDEINELEREDKMKKNNSVVLDPSFGNKSTLALMDRIKMDRADAIAKRQPIPLSTKNNRSNEITALQNEKLQNTSQFESKKYRIFGDKNEKAVKTKNIGTQKNLESDEESDKENIETTRKSVAYYIPNVPKKSKRKPQNILFN